MTLHVQTCLLILFIIILVIIVRIDMNVKNKSGQQSYQFMSLPLHVAVKQQPPTIIVSALIASYPRAVSTKCDGNLPLHLAIQNGASLDVIQTLIAAYPRGLDEPDEMKRKPIEIFEDNEGLWRDEGEKEALANLLSNGVEEIVVKHNNNGAHDKNVDKIEKDVLGTSLREEGWLKVSFITIDFYRCFMVFIMHMLCTINQIYNMFLPFHVYRLFDTHSHQD